MSNITLKGDLTHLRQANFTEKALRQQSFFSGWSGWIPSRFAWRAEKQSPGLFFGRHLLPLIAYRSHALVQIHFIITYAVNKKAPVRRFLFWLEWVDLNHRNAGVKVPCLTAWLHPKIAAFAVNGIISENCGFCKEFIATCTYSPHCHKMKQERRR